MRNFYNISFSRLIASHLPHRLRKSVFIAYLLMLVHPLEELQSMFLSYASTLNTAINTQVCYMRTILNDEFDYFERRIRVRTVKPDFNSELTWHINTPRRTLVGERGSGEECLRNAQGQLGRNIPSFEIVFPEGYVLSDSENGKLKSIVNNNKLASKHYRIVHETII